MATTSTLSMEQYLATTFEPDAEFLNGKVQERNLGRYEHSRIQFLVSLWFGKHESAWGVQGVTEQRMQLSPTCVRIPDIALLPHGRQPEVIAAPPVLVVEIVSPEDRYRDVSARAREFLAWGVNTVWIIDPERDVDSLVGEMWTQPGTCTLNKTLTVAGTEITLDLNDLFQSLQQS